MLTREQIAAFRRPTIAVPVPDLGGEVGMRVLSGSEMADVYGIMADKWDPARFNRLVSVLSVCDETGARMFKAEEADALFAEWSADTCATLINHALKLNRLGQEVRDEARKD